MTKKEAEKGLSSLKALKDSHPENFSEHVDHPLHYNSNPSGVEAITVCEHMSFNVGNAVKYCFRLGLKGDYRTDLMKAQWYLARELERLDNYPGLFKK